MYFFLLSVEIMNGNVPLTTQGFPSMYIGSSQRGGKKLFRAGYEYNIKRQNKDGTSLWSCIQKKICSAVLKTDPKMRILNETEHSHKKFTSKNPNR